MIQVETSVLIHCPMERVLAYVSDPRNNSAWQLEVLSGPDQTSGCRSCSGLVACDAAYDFEPVDSCTCATWTGRVSVISKYQAVEVLVSQIVVLQAEASLALLKSLLETSSYEINGNELRR